MKDKHTGDLIRIEDTDALANPLSRDVSGRDQAGEEEQDLATYTKDHLVFPSGESLPRCWTDPNYQVDQSHQRSASHR